MVFCLFVCLFVVFCLFVCFVLFCFVFALIEVNGPSGKALRPQKEQWVSCVVFHLSTAAAHPYSSQGRGFIVRLEFVLVDDSFRSSEWLSWHVHASVVSKRCFKVSGKGFYKDGFCPILKTATSEVRVCGGKDLSSFPEMTNSNN